MKRGSRKKVRFAGLTVAVLFAASVLLFVEGAASGHFDVLLARRPDTPSLPPPHPSDSELSKGKFLVADHGLGDPRFRQTVILLISHDRRGSMGVIINRPTGSPLSKVFPDSPRMKKRNDPVYYGGPVAGGRMLLLIRADRRPKEASPVVDGVYVSSSRTVLDRLIKEDRKGDTFRLYAGYAGWAAGQLEGEIARGDWHVTRADAGTIFEKSIDGIWPELIRRSAVLHVWKAGPDVLRTGPQAGT